IILVATIGPDSYKLTFEAKGSQNTVPNDAAEVAGAASHRSEVGAEHAVIVAREFVGFRKNPDNVDAHILKECVSVRDVSIMTVEAVINLHEAITQFSYPLDLLKDFFCLVETPKAKLERIKRLHLPTEGFDYRKLLEDLWSRQQNEASGDWVQYKQVYQSSPKWKGKLDFEEFQRILTAL